MRAFLLTNNKKLIWDNVIESYRIIIVMQILPEQIKKYLSSIWPLRSGLQIIDVSRKLRSDVLMKIHFLETNEALEYPFSSILNDPQE